MKLCVGPVAGSNRGQLLVSSIESTKTIDDKTNEEKKPVGITVYNNTKYAVDFYFVSEGRSKIRHEFYQNTLFRYK